MSEMSDKSGPADPPDDPIPGYKAAAILGVSTRTVRRWAIDEKRFGVWEYPERSGYYYSLAEIQAEKATMRRVG